MSPKEKRRHLFKVFLQSKVLFACFSIVLSMLLVVGSTYAWLTSADERINRSEANRRQLSARIDEDFSRVVDWSPGTTKTKKVRVRNDGEVPTLIRVKFNESYISFELDKTDNHRNDANPDNNIHGNANLKVYDAHSTTTPIDVKKIETWTVGNTYEVSANKYYKANVALRDQPYLYKDSGRTVPLSAIRLNFTENRVIDEVTAIEGKSKYWFYEKDDDGNGYFYYSEILDPGEQTEELLATVSLDAGYANQYKGALYKLVPEMEAHDIAKTVLDDWPIKGKNVEKVYKDNERLPYLKNTSGGGTG